MNIQTQPEDNDLLENLKAELNQHFAADEVALVLDFATIHYGLSSLSEMRTKKPLEVYGATLECWRYIQKFDSGRPKVRVFNPDFEQHGWQAKHTVVMVLQKDMPFLIDSLRMAVNESDLTLHAIHNSILATSRNKQGHLKRFCAGNDGSADQNRESFVFMEIDRRTDEQALDDLAASISRVLEQVEWVTRDFAAMKQQLLKLPDSLAAMSAQITKADFKELKDFVQWISNNHFTFLGYHAYTSATKQAAQKNAQAGADEGVALAPVKGSGLGIYNSSQWQEFDLQISELKNLNKAKISVDDVLVFSKSPTLSSVHRPAYQDYISFKIYNAQGQLEAEHRFVGLYTSSVYYQSADAIPVIRRKMSNVLKRAQLNPGSHDWKALHQILQSYPRDELFQITSEDLFDTSLGILQINERRQTRIFIRYDVYAHYYSCLVYTPRDIYNTQFRLKVQGILSEALGSDAMEFTTYFSESILARTHFIVHIDPGRAGDADFASIADKVSAAARSWEDDFHDELIDHHGEEDGGNLSLIYKQGFSSAYREDFAPATAVADVQHLQQLVEDTSLAMSFYRGLEQPLKTVNFKLFHGKSPIPLSDVVPIMENLGLRVMDEHPYTVRRKGQKFWIHNFNMELHAGVEIDINEVRDDFQTAFEKIWRGDAANDSYNRLILLAQLDWREVTMLRAYAAYMKQLRFGISQVAIANCLVQYIAITRCLVDLFYTRLDPAQAGNADNAEAQQQLQDSIIAQLDDVPSLTDDRIIRRYLDLMLATLRTNYFQVDEKGLPKPQLSLKFSPQALADIPKPKPLFEIFVYSPRVQGVHLRGGKVARGGLRWSDRREDFRTEVLGLVKAQQVKNSVIVPVGAKGGFVPQRLTDDMTREEFMAEGIACYRLFIQGLLDITDNIVNTGVDAEIVPPVAVVRHDEDDPYLVVAADKGTATFSDIANGIAQDYDFWLGDAFASGGSQGYDHKKMGITARGAWVSVERHFREFNHNVASQPFTVIGIGDMSGDVFGNGMLLSKSIKLVAAFNHLHIFIDPDPDPSVSFKERQRLFELPRSSWSDYDSTLISKGGGVFSRSAKAIAISPEMKACFDIEQSRMTPNELLHALLQAPVDLLWNGGIGTYVKGSNETDAEVGDKANDAIRVTGQQLRCKVVGEGGNLGLTQQARIEFCLNGGACNTDFIDNAGGVDCSDHEVNVKILLAAVMAEGELTEKQRNTLLKDMTDEIAELVLHNNYHQAQAISLVQAQSKQKLPELRQLICNLESSGRLDRELEFIPADEVLAERKVMGFGLTRAEVSVLISYCKAMVKEALIDTDVPEDPYINKVIETAFPAAAVKRFPKAVYEHKLRREIVSTQVANQMINQMGASFVYRLQLSTGVDIGLITKAFIFARDVFRSQQTLVQLRALDNKVDHQIQQDILDENERLIRRSSRWFLRNRRGHMNLESEMAIFADSVAELHDNMGQWFNGYLQAEWQERYDGFIEAGVDAKGANWLAGIHRLYSGLGLVEVARDLDARLPDVVTVFCLLGEKLELHWFSKAINSLQVETQWQALAREAYRDDLEWQGRALVQGVLQHWDGEADIHTSFDDWLVSNDVMVKRWLGMLAGLKSADGQDYSMYTVATRELFDLAKGASLTD